jgi:hypothetical protein
VHAVGPVQVDPKHVQWVRTAALLMTGSEACIDGRDAHAVVGTPGGDAGELLLALATAEEVLARALSEGEVEALTTSWIDAFGRVYMHTDEHALAALGASLRSDPRFVAYAELADSSIEALVRHPPQELEASLLHHLLEPDHVGCGHLRSMLLSPSSYRIRHELVTQVLRTLFGTLWRAPERIDWVVLQGVHRERAVVVVRTETSIRPYTRVPAVSPASELGQAFVVHPEVTAYLRQQHAYFLRDELPSLRDELSLEALVAAIESVADTQLHATLERLAPGLPWYELRFPEGAQSEGHLDLLRP